MALAATDAPQVLVVTGMSGAGRSTAAKILEDLEYTVIDNLPPTLLELVFPGHIGNDGATGISRGSQVDCRKIEKENYVV